MPRPARVLAVLAAVMMVLAAISLTSAEAPANEHFQRTWARTDQPVKDGTLARTWIWGPEANTGPLQETYVDSPGEKRTVQYFDKSRMEINNPDGDPSSSFYVTNGLLVVELMTGRMQLGNDTFAQYNPSTANVAGDQGDPNSPTYADLAALRSAPPLADGARVIQKLNPDGSIVNDEALAAHNVTAAYRVTVPGIDHQVASPFWSFLNSSGPVVIGGAPVTQRLFDPWFYATGYPITEAYWADVKVGGTVREVLMQCFERRCLTYTPGNPSGFLTEAGNVGQHYYSWRYEQVPGEATPTQTAPASPTTTATVTATTTATVTATTTATATATTTATATATPAAPTSYRYVTRWGGQYSEITPVGQIWSMALDADGNIWATDSDKNRVLQFDPNGVFMRSFGSPGSGNGQFLGPAGITVHNGLVYVVDSRNHRVQVFNTSGVYQMSWGTQGSGNGQYNRPYGITIHNNTVYVSEMSNHRVQMSSLAGVYQGQFGSSGNGNGQFSTPMGMRFDSAGNLHVVDAGNNRVQVLGSGGTYIRKYGSFTDDETGLFFPYEVAFDASGTAYVTSHATSLIQKYSVAGTYLGQWEYDSGYRPLTHLTGILSDGGSLFTLDFAGTGRIQKFTLAGDKLFEINDSRRGRFSAINGIAVDKTGNIMVVDSYDSRPTIARYSNMGTPLNDLLLARLGAANTGDPQAVTVSHDGYIYVAVGGVDRIVKLSSDYGYYGYFGGTGSGPGQLKNPVGLATDSAGNVYVADSGNYRIQKFDADGAYIMQWGSQGSGNGQFNNLHDITVHGNRLYAADFGNNRVQVFDLNGNYIGSFGEPGDGPGQMSYPSDVAVNAYGYILVVEHGNNRVQLFTPEWQPVSYFGTGGSGPGQFSGPLSIAIDNAGYVYVSDVGNYAIHKFAPEQ